MNNENHWTETYFGEGYFSIYKNRLDAAVPKQVAFLNKLLQRTHAKTVLDIPCGYGRHAIALAKLGYKVVGVDLSDTMIKEAQKERALLSQETRDALQFVKSDMRKYRAGYQFDSVVCLFSSLGYYENDEENDAVLKTLTGNLKTDGVLVIDIPNSLRNKKELAAMGWHKEEQVGNFLLVEDYNPATDQHTLSYRGLNGEAGKEQTAVFKEFSLEELEQRLKLYGIEISNVYGSFEEAPYQEDSRRLILVGKKL